MSVELPEAKILAAQINEALVDKKVSGHEIIDSEKLQRIGFMNRDLADYEMLDGQTILGAESPDSPGFTFEYFRDSFSGQNRALKPLLVGKDAVVVGVSNSAFQDVIHRAGLHPKRKASGLTEDETRGLYGAIKALVEERLSLGGKDAWTDLHGKRGGYTPRMGPNMKDGGCPRCGAAIQRLAHGGGHVYLCPECQKE